MAYTPYATVEDYEALGLQDFDDIENALVTASRHIDTLTFNRILGLGGFDKLTPFQQDVIKEVVCKQALFEWENADEINSVISAYSINGVSVKFGDGWNIIVTNGIPMPSFLYSFLQQTGLCCRVIGMFYRGEKDGGLA